MSQHVLSGATVKLLGDFDNEIRKALNSKLEQVAEWFTLEEDKEGYFWALLKPKKFLEKPEFKTMCALVRSIRWGEDLFSGCYGGMVLPNSIAIAFRSMMSILVSTTTL